MTIWPLELKFLQKWSTLAYKSTVSWQSAQVPSQHCIWGKGGWGGGGGGGWEGAATVKEFGQK